MSNLINHKCLITKRNGNITKGDVIDIIKNTKENNHIYSNYYIQKFEKYFILEYIAKHYSLYFESNEFLNTFTSKDIISDEGGAPDSAKEASSQKWSNAIYKFDEVYISGNSSTIESIQNFTKSKSDKNEGITIIIKEGKISANTFNDPIINFEEREKLVFTENCEYVRNALEVWSIKTEFDEFDRWLQNCINQIISYPKNNQYQLETIKIINSSKSIFSFEWPAKFKYWNYKRINNLWNYINE